MTPPCQPRVFAWDRFSAIDGSALTGLALPRGGSWTKNSVAPGVLTVDNHSVHCENTATNRHFYVVSQAAVNADYSVIANLNQFTLVSSDLGVAGRGLPNALTYYRFSYFPVDSTYRLAKFVAGTGSALQTVVGPPPPVTVMLQMWADQISGWINGQLVAGPITDAAIVAPGAPGIDGFGPATPTTGLGLTNFTAFYR